MLDIILDFDFEDNNIFYFCFSQSGEGGSSSSVVCVIYVDNGFFDVFVIFSVVLFIDNGFYFGCCFIFDNEGKLFVIFGDRYKYMDEV